MGYAEAIESQVALQTWYGSKEGRAQLERIVAFRDPRAEKRHVESAEQRILVGLGLGLPFWVNRHMGALIAAAELSWPDDATFTTQDLPQTHGFIRFESPLPLPRRDDGAVRDLCALSWSSYAVFEDREFVPISTDGSGDEGIYFIGYTTIPDHPIPGVIGCQPLVFSDVDRHAEYPKPTIATTTETIQRMAMIARYFRVFCALVRQRVLVTSRQAINNRQVRRRLARAIEHVPEVHVVELRRRDYQQRDESEARDVEYTCQWLVRGHWHQYHTKEGLQPRWVMPYVKGPSDKPLRVAEKVAYEVVR